MAGGISFFELGTDDPGRAKAFYAALFGWSVEPVGEGGYSIRTPNVPGGLHGGDPGAGPYLFFEVDDMEGALARVRELGGSTDDSPDVNGDQETVERFGRFTLCRDDQGSPFGLHQPPAPTT